jgi:hypothetical protein
MRACGRNSDSPHTSDKTPGLAPLPHLSTSPLSPSSLAAPQFPLPGTPTNSSFIGQVPLFPPPHVYVSGSCNRDLVSWPLSPYLAVHWGTPGSRTEKQLHQMWSKWSHPWAPGLANNFCCHATSTGDNKPSSLHLVPCHPGTPGIASRCPTTREKEPGRHRGEQQAEPLPTLGTAPGSAIGSALPRRQATQQLPNGNLGSQSPSQPASPPPPRQNLLILQSTPPTWFLPCLFLPFPEQAEIWLFSKSPFSLSSVDPHSPPPGSPPGFPSLCCWRLLHHSTRVEWTRTAKGGKEGYSCQSLLSNVCSDWQFPEHCSIP